MTGPATGSGPGGTGSGRGGTGSGRGETVLGLDLGGTTIKIALVTDGAVLAKAQCPNRSDPGDLEVAATLVDTLVARHGKPVRAGIAVPGIVDPAATRLVSAHGKYGYALGLDLRDWARERLDLDAVVENDARSALLGEVTSGCAVGATDAVLLVAGTGIGTAAMIDGRLLRGHRGYAGILGGHLTVDDTDEPCNCGNIACAEVFGGSWGLPAGRTLRSVFTDRSAGDAEAIMVSDRVLRSWAITVVSLCHSFDPATVILSGGGMAAAAADLDVVREYVADHLWSSMPRPAVVVADQPALSVVRGLAVLSSHRNADPEERR